jgi:hypothetical protein
MMALSEFSDLVAMAASSDAFQGCKHQASNGRAKGEQAQATDQTVRVGSHCPHFRKIHSILIDSSWVKWNESIAPLPA